MNGSPWMMHIFFTREGTLTSSLLAMIVGSPPMDPINAPRFKLGFWPIVLNGDINGGALYAIVNGRKSTGNRVTEVI